MNIFVKGDFVRAKETVKTKFHHLVKGTRYKVLDTKPGQVLIETGITCYPYTGWWRFNNFELANDEATKMPDRWFIHTPTPEISEAVQFWLFDKGYKWQFRPNGLLNTHSKYLTNGATGGLHIKIGDPYSEHIFKDRGSVEIKFTFETKTTIVDVKIPQAETAAEKELKKLEEQIEALAAQAKALREKM